MLPPHMPKPLKKRQTADITPARGFDRPAVPRLRIVGTPRDGRLIKIDPAPREHLPKDAA